MNHIDEIHLIFDELHIFDLILIRFDLSYWMFVDDLFDELHLLLTTI